MAAINPTINKTILTYLNLLNENNIKIIKAYLFGSYSSGNNKEWSDIDLALISDKFSGDNFDNRNMISKITISVDGRLEPHTFKTSDFNESNPFAREIINTGIRIL
jgi:predicted nucleotidyltransferase